MIVTIDGPAGAGKSTAARTLAARLGFRFLDTGAMYRAVVRTALDRNIPLDNAEQLEALTLELTIELDGERVRVDGRDITDRIRTPEVTRAIHYVADHPGIRARLVELQRKAAAGKDLVAEGRDQGTVVFPAAECKVFLTASTGERAVRRQAELKGRGIEMTLEEVAAQQADRDRRDRGREVGALRVADDAITLVTDGMQPEEVVAQLVNLVQQRRAQLPDAGGRS